MNYQTENQQRFVQQCAKQQRLASGKRYKNESSMQLEIQQNIIMKNKISERKTKKDILTWGVEDVTQSNDYKKQSINMKHEEELKRFSTKIQKSPTKSMTTEFQDNYRGYIFVPEEQAYVPALAKQQLDYLEGPVYIPAPPIEARNPEKEYNPTEMEYSKIKKGTQYRNYYGKLKNDNKKELYDVLYDNFVEMYPNKVSYNTKIPRKDLYHEENYDEYQQEVQEISQHQLELEEEARLQNLQEQQRNIQSQIQENQRQLQLKEQLQKEQHLVNLNNELQQLLNEQKRLTIEIQNLKGSKGQGFSSYQPIAVAPEDERRLKEREKRIQKFGESSRQLPNSAFSTYYGKPAFENYGNQNVKDKNSGFITGNYLKTHNVNPHRGESKPEYLQTYQNAISIANEDVQPHPPRHRLDEIPTKKQLEYHRKSNPFYPQQNEILNQSRKNQVISASNINKVHPLLRKPQNTSQIVIHNHPENQQKESPTSSQQSQKQQKQQNVQQQLNGNKGNSHNPNIKVEIQNPQTKKSEEDYDTLAQDRSPMLPEPHPSVESENQSSQNLIYSSSKFQQSANNFTGSQAMQIRQQGKMELLNKKKEKSNLIVTKVTDIPQYNEITFQTRVDHPIDAMNPPTGHLFAMHEYELNPQYYKTINQQWIKRIPYAGKKAMVQEDLFEILQHQPIGQDPVY